MSLLKTSLHQQHIDLGAKMAGFAGFDMPLQYSSVKEESIAVRSSLGVFDVSHMGEFFVTGPDAISFVDFIITNDFAGAEMEKAVYSPLCREDGTVIDDLIAYKLADEKVLICVNASNIEKDWSWISSKTEGFNIQLEDQSSKYSLLAVQGPKAEEVLKSLEVINDSDNLVYYSAKELTRMNEQIIVARTGYTGEDGFEVFTSHEMAATLWSKLLESGAIPCGLASRDVLRLEVCYPLYGHELNDELTPLDASLKWTVKSSKDKFIGKAALEASTPTKRLVKLSLEKGIPREGYNILNMDDQVIGVITSGTMSVELSKGIALGLVDSDKFPKDKKFKINIRKNNIEANYHTKAFVTGGHK
ncbi:glycine cleavage system aminomethyltransferase GcvT [Halobacteriovorax sp. JY17]|uniref:glycine cleavage system aminomethyltransferase GcvT n=1 Tax=Halobacteriovorax sp. JY17 TaxID=2014617 RepID=UPI000C6370DD|nr:glycine cleavage system aminomethyltransferase GcvT [Halobacteriovorax sp. JY17]PIK14219.1 MAG: glycine cleavage system protein T [Halobacteriovorax sp. JY17]